MIRTYTRLARAATVFNWRRDIAYFAGFMITNIVNLTHVAAFIFFYLVLFQNTDDIAGYNRDQMLLFYLTGQLTYYSYVGLFEKVPRRLSTDINRGALDFVLLRPINKIVLLTVEVFSLLAMVRGLLLSLIVVFIIDWSNLGVVSMAIAPGIFIALSGIVLMGALHMILASAAFWTGESERLLIFTTSLTSQHIPFDAANKMVKAAVFYVFPVMIKSGLAVSVMTGRVSIMGGLLISIALLVVFTVMARFMWQNGLRAYTSASS